MHRKLEPGEYYVWCDRTGFKRPNCETLRQGDGLVVWDRVYDERHPQDFVRGVRENPSVGPNARPKSADRFLGTNEITSEDL